MKKINIKYISIALGLITVSGCKKDFLNLSPISNANVNAFYKSPADINNAVLAAYALNEQIYTSNLGAQEVLDEVRSDNTELSGIDQVDRFINDSGKEWYGWSWDASYRAIYTFNVVIEQTPKVSMDAKLQNQYIAEARFLRANTYFELVQNFGGVPLVTATVTSLSPSAIDIPRNSVAEVYTQIISDLTFAAQNLPASYSSSGDVGRATSGAANGILGKVYLTMGNTAAAKTALTAVVSSGLYKLLPTYAAVFDVNNRNSTESMFELQFKAPLNGSPFESFFATSAAGLPGGGYYYNIPTTDLVNAFEDGDARKAVTFAQDPNGLYYCNKFYDPTMTTFAQSNHNFPILRYADVLLLLAEADGDTPDAYALINEVRERAGLGAISDGTGTFKDQLLHERRVELAFENQRWHDLLRFGVAIPVMNAQLAPENVTLTQNDLLMPIPATALAANPKLSQNPGYN